MLTESILDAWENIDLYLLDKLVKSMQRRCIGVLHAKGRKIDPQSHGSRRYVFGEKETFKLWLYLLPGSFGENDFISVNKIAF